MKKKMPDKVLNMSETVFRLWVVKELSVKINKQPAQTEEDKQWRTDVADMFKERAD